jgi:hypothetical protein
MVKYMPSCVLIAETHLAVEQSADAIPHNKMVIRRSGNWSYMCDISPLAEVILRLTG